MSSVQDIIRRNIVNRIDNQIINEDIMRIYIYYYNDCTTSISIEWDPDLEKEFIISRIGFLQNDRPLATIDIQDNIIEIIYHKMEKIEKKVNSKYIKESYNANKNIIKIQR